MDIVTLALAKKYADEKLTNIDGSSSTQSDWNQNDETALDYIKNRPFYAGDPELTEVFNGNISFNNHASFINHFSLLEGETYQVIWNNKEYFCTCQKSTIGANQFLCIGNTSLAATDSTQWIDGEPFLIQDGGFATIVNTSDDNSSCNAIVNIYKEYVKLLDRKFVSYMAGENVEGKIVTYNDQTYTCPTGAEIFNSPNNKAIGLYSHAEGHGTVAYGAWCHAEGVDTYVNGNGSHAEGQSTIVEGAGSHAEGGDTIASGDYIHVEGYNTIASSNYQHVQGKYNVEDTEEKYAHIVGNGTKNTPSNAHTLDWDGNAWYQGDVYVGSNSGVIKDEGSKKLATEDFVSEKFNKLSQEIADQQTALDGMTLGVHTDGLIYVFVNGEPKGTGVEFITASGDVVGYVDSENNIVLTGKLTTGTYTFKYEMEDGSMVNIGSVDVTNDEEIEDSAIDALKTYTVHFDKRYSNSSGGLVATQGVITIEVPIVEVFGKTIKLTGFEYGLTYYGGGKAQWYGFDADGNLKCHIGNGSSLGFWNYSDEFYSISESDDGSYICTFGEISGVVDGTLYVLLVINSTAAPVTTTDLDGKTVEII